MRSRHPSTNEKVKIDLHGNWTQDGVKRAMNCGSEARVHCSGNIPRDESTTSVQDVKLYRLQPLGSFLSSEATSGLWKGVTFGPPHVPHNAEQMVLRGSK